MEEPKFAEWAIFAVQRNMPIRRSKAEQRELLAGVESALAGLPDVSIVSSKERSRVAGREFDAVIVADVKGRQVMLVVEAKSGGSPRDVQAAAWHLVPVQHMPDKPTITQLGPDGDDEVGWAAPWVPLVAAP